MSRSRRKQPITGITTARSERLDKRQWHSRMRSQERAALSQRRLQDEREHIPVHRHDVGSVWAMAKDGKQYFPLFKQRQQFQAAASRLGRTDTERRSLLARKLHKFMAK